MDIERASLQCELEVDLLASQNGLRCEFAYRPALFDQEMISRLMVDFGTLVRDVARESDLLVANMVARLSETSGSGTG